MTTLRGRDALEGGGIELDVAHGVVTDIRRFATGDPDLPWLAPGLVDLQVNGYRGFDVNDPALTTDTLVGLADALLGTGVTTFVPTIVSGPPDRTEHILRTIANARREVGALARAMPWVHLEGPYISGEEGPRGCHDPSFVRPPDVEELRRWMVASDDLIGMVTVSPHWPGSVAFIGEACARGVRVAIGHTHASPEAIRIAVDAGARYSTHLGNGAHATIARHPNYIWTQLAERRLEAGFIADGQHLPPDAFAAMLRAKGLDHAYLVSDVAALAGMPPGRYAASVGGDVEVTADGRLVSAGTPYLAGAVAPLADGVARAALMADLTIGQAMRLATIVPGRIAEPGGGRGPGRIALGAPVDCITFRWSPGALTLSDIRTVHQEP